MVFARYPACKKITLMFLRGYPVHVLAVISRGFPGESQLDASFFFCVCTISLRLLLVHFFSLEAPVSCHIPIKTNCTIWKTFA